MKRLISLVALVLLAVPVTYLAKTAPQRAAIDADFGGKSPCR